MAPPADGKVQVNITGLPSGVPGDVLIASDDGTTLVVVTETWLVESLQPGWYTATMNDAKAPNGVDYQATVAVEHFQMLGGETHTINVEYKEKYGKVQVNITGLPDGVDADGRVDKDDLSWGKEVTKTTLIDSLLEGQYTATFLDVTAPNGVDYIPIPSKEAFNIIGGVTHNVNVQYKEKYGKIQVNISGLPAGVGGDVAIDKGDLSWGKEVIESILIDSVLEGQYTATCFEVTAPNGVVYIPTPSKEAFNVIGGATYNLNIQYKEKYCKIQVNITGLPNGVDGDVEIEKNDHSLIIAGITASRLIDSLLPGWYTATMEDVTSPSGVEYEATTASETFEMDGGDTYTLNVVYKEKFGKIQVNITSLPEGIPADVLVKSDDGNTQVVVTETWLIDSLTPGDYTATMNDVTTPGGVVYTTSVGTEYFNLPGGTTHTLNVEYKEKYGKVQVNITGLPDNVDGDVKIEKDDHTLTIDNITETQLIDSLLEGDYTAIMRDVTTPEGVDYVPTVSTQLFQVIGGETYTLDVEYKEKYGRLQLNVTGLPDNVDGNVVLSKDDGTMTVDDITETVLIDSLLEGDYTLQAFDVITPQGDSLLPEPITQPVEIFGGQTVTASIEYKGPLSFRLFSGPPLHPGVADNNGEYMLPNDNTLYEWRDLDYINIPESDTGYIRDGCYRIIGHDITDAGLSYSISASGGGAEATSSLNVEVSKESRELVFTYSNSASATAMAVERGQVYSHTIVYFGSGFQSLPQLAIEIENQSRATIDVVFEWSFSGEVQDGWAQGMKGADGYWLHNCWVFEDPPLCYSSPYPDPLYVVDPDQGEWVGSDTITFTDSRKLLGIRQENVVHAEWRVWDQAPYGKLTAESSASSSGTLRIKIIKR